MWVRSQNKETLVDCSSFKIKQHKRNNIDFCEYKIAKKYDLKKQGDSEYTYYSLTKEQRDEVSTIYSSPENEYYAIENGLIDGYLLAFYSTKEKALKVISMLEQHLFKMYVGTNEYSGVSFQFPKDEEVILDKDMKE